MIRYLLLLLLPLTLFGQSQKISDMTSATSLTGSEYVPIVQTTNKKATVGLLRGWTSLGTAGQLLKVNSGATALEFFTPSFGGGSWGSITGTLSSQTDLQTALDDKFSLTNGGTLAGASVLLDGDGNTFTINNVDVFTLGATSSLDFDAPAFTFSNGPVSFEAGTTSYSSLKIPHGTAPTSPVDGDLWSTTSGFFGRVNGSTVGPFGTGGGLTIGTSTITSGTNTRVLYNNSGILGEYTVSGSGNVAMTTSPTFTTPILGTPTSGTLTNTTGYLFNNLAAATGTNTINNAANAQEWQWNTLAAGTGLLLSSSSTAAASNTNTLFRVNQTGANATSTQTTYGGYFSNKKTGTSSTNVGLYAEASGGTTNEAIRTNGGIIVTGSGLTTGTSFRINNSSNAERYKIQDNGSITHSLANSVLASITTGQHTLTTSAWYDHAITMVNSGSTSLTGFEFRQNNMTTFLTGTGRYIMTRSTFGNTTAGTINGNYISLLIGTKATNDATSSFNPNAGTGTWTGLHIDPIYNTTGSYSGTVYGINYDPVVTSSTGLTHLSFRASAGNMLVPASSYINFGTTSGSSGYGFRDNGGTMEFKNSAGSWTPIGDANVKQVKVTVSSAELLASFTTPKTLIAAPGAGYYIQIISCEMFLDYNSAAYVDGGGGGVTIDYVNSLSTLTGIFSISSTSDTMSFLDVASGQRALTNVENKPVILYSPTSNPTTGNSPLYVYLTYRIVTL